MLRGNGGNGSAEKRELKEMWNMLNNVSTTCSGQREFEFLVVS